MYDLKLNFKITWLIAQDNFAAFSDRESLKSQLPNYERNSKLRRCYAFILAACSKQAINCEK